jgi:hypothetical protein
MPLNALTYLIHQFVLAILLVKVNKSYFFEGKNVTSHQGGGGRINVTKCYQVGGGSKKCHVLFEWPLKTNLYFCCLVIILSQSQSNSISQDNKKNVYIQESQSSRYIKV